MEFHHFKFEEGCCLLGSWILYVWLIVRHGNMFLVTWEVEILWYQMKFGHKRKETCFNFELTVSCPSSLIFMYSSVYARAIPNLVQIFWCWSFSQVSHHRMPWLNILTCIVHPVWIKYIWSGATRAVDVFRISSQVLHFGLQWLSLQIPWTLHLVWHIYHQIWQVGLWLC